MRILLITYYFPPCGGAAVQRWLRFLPHLVDDGFQITVVTPEKVDYPVLDKGLNVLIPPEVEVIRTPNLTLSGWWRFLFGCGKKMPYGTLERSKKSSLLFSMVLWIRINLIFPDIRVIWNRFAIANASKLLARLKYDLIITTGPPHSTHLVGMKLQKRYHTPWIADFRDPWSDIHYLHLAGQSQFACRRHKKMESMVLHQARGVLTVSEGIRQHLPKGRIHVIYNGFEAKHFAGLHYRRSTQFRIKYVGRLTAGQDLRSLVNYVASALPDARVEFHFIGTEIDPSMLNQMKNIYPSCRFETIGFLPHRTALDEMVNAELLLLLINRSVTSRGILTTKLFEYCGSRTPILCYGLQDSEAAQVIRDHQAGYTVSDLKDSDGMAYLRHIYAHWAENIPVRTTSDLSQISVQYQSQELADTLRRIANSLP